MRGAWQRWGLLALWVGVVLALGSTTIFPDNRQVPRFLLRKAAHLGLYAVLALLLVRALASLPVFTSPGRGAGQAGRRWALAALALALVALVAGVDEWHQALVPGRSARLSDVGLDALGGALGLLAGRLLGALRRRRNLRGG